MTKTSSLHSREGSPLYSSYQLPFAFLTYNAKQEYHLIMVLSVYKQAYEQVWASTSNYSFLERKRGGNDDKVLSSLTISP